jgi:hypothetical protein
MYTYTTPDATSQCIYAKVHVPMRR